VYKYNVCYLLYVRKLCKYSSIHSQGQVQIPG
jgi:hypothetical protein